MTAIVLPVLFVLILWWFSTGAILWLARGADEDMRPRLLMVTILCAFGVGGTIITSGETAEWASYVGFVSALAVWGWVEFTFLSGMLTGPRKLDCPADAVGRVRFRLAFRTISSPEYALVAALATIALVSFAGQNHY